MEENRYRENNYNDIWNSIRDMETGEWLQRKDLLIDRLNIQDQKIKELQQEITKLKQKAIVPKFDVSQTIFFINNDRQIEHGVINTILTGQDTFEKWVKYSVYLGQEYEDDIRFVDKDEEDIFATKAEAERKLVEKEKEISEYVKIVDDLHKQLSDKCDFCDKTKDQDKISFAIEQLEKVKGLIANHTQELWTCENDDIDLVLYEEIDNQIKELKGEE